MKRVYWQLMPFLILCYIVAFLDRVNVGFAALHMNADLGFTATVYGFGAGILDRLLCLRGPQQSRAA
jgi:ACS family tartrate transporter-like MFS transporter